jgi:hypothetical protein
VGHQRLHWSEAVARGGVEPPTFRFSDLGKTVQEHSSNLSGLVRDVSATTAMGLNEPELRPKLRPTHDQRSVQRDSRP